MKRVTRGSQTKVKVNASATNETANKFDRKLKRIASYKEFDNGHVMFTYSQMTQAEADALAKQKSIEDPNNIYYVKYDDIMNPDNRERWVAGKKYHDHEVQMRGDKPIIKSEAVTSAEKKDLHISQEDALTFLNSLKDEDLGKVFYQYNTRDREELSYIIDDNDLYDLGYQRAVTSASRGVNKKKTFFSQPYKGYRIRLLQDGTGYAIFDGHGEMEDHGFRTADDAKKYVDDNLSNSDIINAAAGDARSVLYPIAKELRKSLTDYGAVSLEFSPQSEYWYMEFDPNTTEGDATLIYHFLRAEGYEEIMETGHDPFVMQLEKDNVCVNILTYADGDIRVEVSLDEDLLATVTINASESSTQYYRVSYVKNEVSQAILVKATGPEEAVEIFKNKKGIEPLGCSPVYGLDVDSLLKRGMPVIEAATDADNSTKTCWMAKYKDIKGQMHKVCFEFEGTIEEAKAEADAIIRQPYTYLNVLGRCKKDMATQDGFEFISAATDVDMDTMDLAGEIHQSVQKEVIKVMTTNPEFGYPEDEAKEYSRVDAHFKDNGERLYIEVGVECDYDGLMTMCEALDPLVQYYDKDCYFEPIDPGLIGVWIDLATAKKVTSSTAVEAGLYDYPEPPLDPPEDDSWQDLDASDEVVEIDLNGVEIVIDKDGSWTYSDESYAWTKPDDKSDTWYSDEYHVRLGDNTDMVEHVDELLEVMLPSQPGKYRLNGTAYLVFSVEGIQVKREYFWDERHGGDYDEEAYTDDAEVYFESKKSKITEFEVNKVK